MVLKYASENINGIIFYYGAVQINVCTHSSNVQILKVTLSTENV